MLHQKSAQHTNSASATTHSALVDTVNRWQQLSIRVQFFIYIYRCRYYLLSTLHIISWPLCAESESDEYCFRYFPLNLIIRHECGGPVSIGRFRHHLDGMESSSSLGLGVLDTRVREGAGQQSTWCRPQVILLNLARALDLAAAPPQPAKATTRVGTAAPPRATRDLNLDTSKCQN